MASSTRAAAAAAAVEAKQCPSHLASYVHAHLACRLRTRRYIGKPYNVADMLGLLTLWHPLYPYGNSGCKRVNFPRQPLAFLSLICWLPLFCERGALGLTMALSDRVMVCSHRLSIQTTVVSGTVWPQFAMQVLTGGCEPQFGGRGGRTGWRWVPWVAQ